jgi:CRISPR-associated protein Csd1
VSWISRLCETYDYCSEVAWNARDATSLIPIGHTTQNASVEIIINRDGKFLSARVLDKSDITTVIPCSEDSANRTSKKLAPHPLFDKLQYVAGDYPTYVSSKKSGFDLYVEQLRMWCESQYSHEMVQAILSYVLKKTLIADLIQVKILPVDDSGKILEKWLGDPRQKPEIFKHAGVPTDAFVRFCVEIPGLAEARVWLNQEVRQKFVDYYLNTFSTSDICYATGKMSSIARFSAGKIRNIGDKAKLISSNDNDGFTFRGRFTNADQAMCMSYVASQKSVNALKWLIAKQGYRNGDQVIVSWGTRDEALPSVCGDFWDSYLSTSDENVLPDTKEEFVSRLNKAISGYSTNLKDNSNVVVMGLDSVTKGRLSITYYRDLSGSELLKRIERWQISCSWYPICRRKKTLNKRLALEAFCGAPVPIDIAMAAYGEDLNAPLKKKTILRLLPCIVDGKPLPWDIVASVATRVSRPSSMELLEYNKSLGVACALVRKFYNDRKNTRNPFEHYNEVWKMDLDCLSEDRNYLFGRLLAYARKIEELSIRSSGGSPRQTNAERAMPRFHKLPARTWSELYQKLLPYMAKFRTTGPDALGNRYESEMNAIMESLKVDPAGFNDASLTPLYLLGYQSQLNHFEIERKEAIARKKLKEEAERAVQVNSINGEDKK